MAEASLDINMLTIGELKNMTYGKLQTVAKSLNIKANMKSHKLLAAILDKIAPKFEEDDSMMETSITTTQSTSSPGPQHSIRRRTYEITPKPEENGTESEKVEDKVAENQHSTLRLHSKVSKQKRKSMKKTQVAPSQRSLIPRRVLKQKPATPNFQQIHQKAFDKMESVHEYAEKMQQKRAAAQQYSMQSALRRRRADNNAPNQPSKPSISQAPPNIFKPAVFSTSKMNLNFGENTSKLLQCARQLRSQTIAPVERSVNSSAFTFTAQNPSKPITALERRKQYDVAISLRRKLQYKPYSGPIKPFTINSTASQTHEEGYCSHHIKHDSQDARVKQRSLLNGVRKNKRHEFQQNVRNIRP